MKKKVAKLVEYSLLVRILVDEDATDDEIIAASYPKVQDKIDNRELGDNLVSVEDDEECPFGTFTTDTAEASLITSSHIVAAGGYLVDTDMRFADMIKAIINHPDQDSLIDYVDGVTVWEKVEYEFTCKQFLELIGFTK